ARSLAPRIKLIGVEPEGADDAYRSLQAGKLMPQASNNTIADGLRATLSERTFGILRTHDCHIVTVSESAIVEGMRFVWERMKIIIEPSAAVTVASLLENKIEISSKRVGVILSGGNVDLDHLPW
ncbi:MAG: pyridoxal-phosphate dependent enzyme, partial [bacterium]